MFNLQQRSEENTNTKRHQVIETRNYSMFKLIRGNRDLNEGNVKSIMHQIQQHGQQQPIIVNEKYEVIDGQHRLEACKRLKKPVIFYKKNGASIKHVISTNVVGKKWTTRDYFNRFASEGNENYTRGLLFIDYAKKKGFPLTAALYMMGVRRTIFVMCSDGEIRYKQSKKVREEKIGLYDVGNNIQLGLFECPPQNEMHNTLNAILLFDEWDFGKTKVFVSAVIRLLQVEGFDIERLKTRAQRYPRMFTREPSTLDYIEMIEKVYNYRSKNKLALKHLA